MPIPPLVPLRERFSMTSRSRIALGLALLLAVSGAPMASAADVDETLVLQPQSSAASGSAIDTASAFGTVGVHVDVVTLDGGVLRVATGTQAKAAFDYPAFTRSSTPPRAVMRVRNSGTADDLAPGRADFTIGADFELDPLSTGSSVDNGDNLIQRGTFGSQSQYKIDADGGKVSCRIKGSSGVVIVKSSARVTDGLWYQTRCSRVGTAVTLDVKEYRRDGTTRRFSDTRRGDTGSLTWANRRTPLSVGGKLTARGTIVRSSTDQFNGSIGRLIFRTYS